MFSHLFEIAGITIALKTESQITISEKFRSFLRDEYSEYDYGAVFHQVNELQKLPELWLKEEPAFDVGKDAEGIYYRRFWDTKQGKQVYATAYYDWERKHIEVKYLPEGWKSLNQSDNCFFHIAWETIMQLEKRLILHACAVDTPYGGILFSGRSGIGKSTQGDLWCRYENASVVNGDRPFIWKEGNIWYAYGAPYAGSSRCHRDIRTPIRAIVMLRQGETCVIRRMNTAEAFRSIYSGLTLSTWNPQCVQNSCDLAIALASEVPVYELECTPDQQAVELLKRTLLTEERL